MKFDIITIFPEIIKPYLSKGLLNRAQKSKKIRINVHDLRDYTKDRHRKVDDKAFGGGLGMVMKVDPIYRAVKKISEKGKVIVFTPRGKKFNQKVATQLAKADQLIFICGRYEGIDERVSKKIADIELSIGDYVLMGGEIPALAVIETVSRLVPGVIGKDQFLQERKSKSGFIEGPQYTRPEVFSPKKGVNWKVPKVLVFGDHKKIKEYKEKYRKIIEK